MRCESLRFIWGHSYDPVRWTLRCLSALTTVFVEICLIVTIHSWTLHRCPVWSIQHFTVGNKSCRRICSRMRNYQSVLLSVLIGISHLRRVSISHGLSLWTLLHLFRLICSIKLVTIPICILTVFIAWSPSLLIGYLVCLWTLFKFLCLVFAWYKDLGFRNVSVLYSDWFWRLINSCESTVLNLPALNIWSHKPFFCGVVISENLLGLFLALPLLGKIYLLMVWYLLSRSLKIFSLSYKDISWITMVSLSFGNFFFKGFAMTRFWVESFQDVWKYFD